MKKNTKRVSKEDKIQGVEGLTGQVREYGL